MEYKINLNQVLKYETFKKYPNYGIEYSYNLSDNLFSHLGDGIKEY